MLPLVEVFLVRSNDSSYVFSRGRFNRSILRQFSTLNSVQRLVLDYLDIPSFMPEVRRYFGHFLPTVQDLALGKPKGSRRQVIYFIGMFQHLEQLELFCDGANSQEDPADDLTLLPPFVPPTARLLKVGYFARVHLLEDMIDLFGGFRFRHMDLFDVDGMRLLDAGADPLETLRLYPTDPRGGEASEY